ncbi:unnamed protein product [Aspergillus oryzae]|nr:unnamed protein product [Aspergillus oryzae]
MSFPFRIIEHTIPGQHIRESPRSIRGRQETPIKIAIKQYIPNDADRLDPTPDNAITIIGVPGNGSPKEIYEPLWEDLYRQLKKLSVPVRGIWVADTSNQGASAVLNEEVLGDQSMPSKMGSPSSGPLSPPRTPPGANPTLQPSYRPQSTPDSSNTHNNQAPRILELLHAEPRTRGTRPSSPTRLGRRERATVFVFQAGMLVRHAESAVRAAQCALGVWWEELSLSPGCAGVEDADYGDGDWGEWWGG